MKFERAHRRIKSFIAGLLATGALSCAAAASVPPVFPGCAAPSERPNHAFWFDAAHGDDARGDGSEGRPWKTVQSLLAEAPWGAPKLSTVPYPHVDRASGVRATAPNPDAPVKPGDLVYLKDGDYGRLLIGTWGRAVVNSDFVTIAAAPGAHPVVSQIAIQEAHKFRITGLKLQSLAAAEKAPALFFVTPGTTSTSDIILDGADIAPIDDASAWATQADWLANSRNGVTINGGGKATCVSLVGNHIHNVKFGAYLGGDRTLFEGNEIDHLGDDGIDISGNHIWVLKNKEQDFQQLGDGIDVEIAGNVIVTSACWGVSWGSTHNGFFAHNTIAFDGSLIGVSNKEGKRICDPQLAIGTPTHQYKEGGGHVLAINNIAPTLTRASVGAGPFVAVGNVAQSQFIYTDPVTDKKTWQRRRGVWTGRNVVLAEPPEAIFRKFDPSAFAYDLRLKPGSFAVGRGVAMPQGIVSGFVLPERGVDGELFGARREAGAYAERPELPGDPARGAGTK